MIRRTIALLSIAIAMATAGVRADAADLTVTITDLSSTQGSIGVQVVNSEAAWDGKAVAVDRQRLPANAKELKFNFSDLPPGEYAVMVMHDENGNGQLDFDMSGLPREGYGFSNNPDTFGRPRFKDARFALAAEGGAITIRLQ